MTKRNLITVVFGVFTLCTAVEASAQPRWGHETMPRSGACFYENINFGGRYFCVAPGEDLRQMPNGMGDRISSMRVIGPMAVTVFKDNDMHGRSARFVADVRDLRRDGWNDQISSIEVSGHGNYRGDRNRYEGTYGNWDANRAPIWGREAAPREGACFYEDANYHGQYFCVPRGATYVSLPRGFNDRISSIKVFGAGVRIYQNRDFKGHSREVSHDVSNLRGDWRDTVSSIRVF